MFHYLLKRIQLRYFAGIPVLKRLLLVVAMTNVWNQSTWAQASDTISIEPNSFSVAAFNYFIPEQKNAVTFIGTADIRQIHLESRYNYEDRNTGSVFAGYRFDKGKKLQLSLTPMAGLVFGNTDGIATGLEFELSFKKLSYYTEQEYIFDLHNKANNFLYVWGEVSYNFFDSFTGGICYQKTKVYQNALELQRGIFSSYTWRSFHLGAYYFNPFSNDNVFVASLSVTF